MVNNFMRFILRVLYCINQNEILVIVNEILIFLFTVYNAHEHKDEQLTNIIFS